MRMYNFDLNIWEKVLLRTHPNSSLHFLETLEIPVSRVFLDADAQVLGTSLIGARMS